MSLRLQVPAWLAVQKRLILTLTEQLMKQKHQRLLQRKLQQQIRQHLLLTQQHQRLIQQLRLKHQLNSSDALRNGGNAVLMQS